MRTVVWLILIVLLLETPVLAEEVSPALSVNVVTPTMDKWPQTIEASGVIQPWHQSVIGTQIGGLAVSEIFVDVGDSVEAGQLLARLQSASLKLEQIQAEASLLTATANVTFAESNLARSERMSGKNWVSDQSLQQLRVNVDLAKAELQKAKAQLEASELALQYAEIRAVDDGIVTERNISLGEVVALGKIAFTLIRQNKMEWLADVDTKESSLIKIGSSVVINTATGKARGQVRTKSPAVNSNTQFSNIYVTLPKNTGVLAGEIVTGYFELASSPVVTLPESSIVWRDGKSMLMRVGDDDRITSMIVKIGRSNGNRIEIITPVDNRARYVVSGGAFLHNGDVVSVVPSLSATTGK